MIAERTETLARPGSHATGSPLLEVAPDVAGLQTVMVNLYLVGFPGQHGNWVLVDAGLPFFSGRILEAAERRFGAGTRPQAILLTHGHFDHVGVVRELAERWDVPVYAHEAELPFLTGRADYAPPDPTVGGGLMARMAGLYPRRVIDLGHRARPLPSDGSVPGLTGWQWIATPGHTPGHVSFYREADRVLIVGDAFITTKQESALSVLLQLPAVHGPPTYFTPDWDAARASVRKLASLRPLVAAAGHGLPMQGEKLDRELQELARNFDELALPRQGRYVPRDRLARPGGSLGRASSARSLLQIAATLGVTVGVAAVLNALRRKTR